MQQKFQMRVKVSSYQQTFLHLDNQKCCLLHSIAKSIQKNKQKKTHCKCLLQFFEEADFI